MTDKKLLRVLRQLRPLDAVDEALLEHLGPHVRVARLPRDSVITPDSYAESVVYLLDGYVVDRADGAARPTLRDGQLRPLPPLFGEDGGRDATGTLHVQEDARLLRVAREAWERARSVIGYERSEGEVSDAGSELLERLHAAYSAGRLTLPAMPNVAVNVQRLADSPDTDIGDLTRLIGADPVTTGRIIQAANGPLYRADRPVTRLQEAVGRLGFRTTAVMARSVALRGTFRAQAPTIRAHMERLWSDAARVGSLSHAIARRLDGFDADTALLTGLLHNVGAIPILHYAEAAGVTREEEIERCIGELRAPIGLVVLSSWGMDETFTTVLCECHDLQRDTGGSPDYCDVVLVARVLRHATPDDEALDELAALPAWRSLGLDRLADGTVAGLLREAGAEIDAMDEVLRG